MLSRCDLNSFPPWNRYDATICLEHISACQALSQIPRLEGTLALEEKIKVSSVVSTVIELALRILEAPSRSLASESGQSCIIVLPHTMEALDTMDAVAHTLMAIAVALWQLPRPYQGACPRGHI